ncbi:MAG: DNA repair protein RecO [Candidatus Omnitrophica bacterium]|nr:DNA repair protein RecO [Candidatus Omnitrophota bacterium]
MIIQTEGIILKTYDLRETSKLAVFYTPRHGKVKGVLKGIRKDPRKFGSHADRFSINDIVYYQYSRSDIHLISQCDLKQFFFPIRQDYRKTLAAHYFLELIDAVMPSEHAQAGIYRLTLDALNALEQTKDIDRLVHVFQIKILNLSGFRPHIDACVRCNRRIDGRSRFSLALGGMVCGRCPAPDTAYILISPGAVSSILYIERAAWEEALRLGLTISIRRELKYILNNFLVYHLERKIKSARYLLL